MHKCPAVCSWMVNYSATKKTIQLWRNWLEFRLVEPWHLSTSYTLAVCLTGKSSREVASLGCHLMSTSESWPKKASPSRICSHECVSEPATFLGSSRQMPDKDVWKTQEIASLRIHVERTINKIKNFHIWDHVIPMHHFGVINQMWAITAFICDT